MTNDLGTADDDAIGGAGPLDTHVDGTPDVPRAEQPGDQAPPVDDSSQERLDRLAAPLDPRTDTRSLAEADPIAPVADPLPAADPAAPTDPAAVTDAVPAVADPVLATDPAPTPRAVAAASVTAPILPPPPPPSLFMPPEAADGGTPAGAAPPPSLALADATRHQRRPWTMVVVTLALAVLIALSTYLLVAARALEQRNAEWEQVARLTGHELAQARDDLAGALAELDGTRAQLGAAQNRITELADEKAQLGDDREVQQRVVDYQEKVSEAARKVTTALTSCVDGQNKLIEYMQDPTLYDATDLTRFRTDVTRVCEAATDANTALQEVLGR
ncbi:hypothetical protein [Cellulomonas timonensis]|uniref:hypothetical protein n=1 Tax=Cellulomonas timonensis TaxID=1689271 RepID=UPI000A9F0AFC|nr:hypothetical protein [Cellulomonas timonensis]